MRRRLDYPTDPDIEVEERGGRGEWFRSCPTCHEVEAVISGWEETLWADGPMDPVPMTDD
jgi:hypothetical protein